MRRPTILRTRLLPLAALLLSVAALPSLAGEIYQWKDARGVTHYSDSAPVRQKHTTRTLSQRGPIAPAPLAGPKVAANSDCSNAHANLTLLQGTGRVGVDENKDGKVDRDLTAVERAQRLKLALTQVETYCDAPAANAVTTR